MEVDATAADGPLTGRRRAAEREASPRGAGGAYLGRGRAAAGAAGRADGGDGGGGSGGGRGLRSLLGIRRRRRRRRRQPGSALSSDAGGGAAHVRARAGRRFIWRSARSGRGPEIRPGGGRRACAVTPLAGSPRGPAPARPRTCPANHLRGHEPRKNWQGALLQSQGPVPGAVSRENLARGRVLGEPREGLLPNVSLAPPPAAVLLKAAVESAVMAAGRCHTVFFHTGPELRSGPRVPPMGKD
ncbi:WAS/WASL-interacting protein family member 1-like [Myotis daubentonii]|uniref:WAS/WASL-interacting protein family member 1-like n=1 Tax=Myotis daubentonii TaxID=98922 RepID=UPI002873AD6C|nr:WAS/WASL-interacting protein family member 1-like [Myotis daubentonii]